VALAVSSRSVPAQPIPATKPSSGDVLSGYERIRSLIGDDPKGKMCSWNMSGDHLFIVSGEREEKDSLRALCRRFVRLNGSIDFLYRRLLDDRISSADVLAITEVLVFWADDDQPGDELIKSSLSDEIFKALEAGKFKSSESVYPDMNISIYLKLAAAKSSPTSRP
jgi:hypothetical protein